MPWALSLVFHLALARVFLFFSYSWYVQGEKQIQVMAPTVSPDPGAGLSPGPEEEFTDPEQDQTPTEKNRYSQVESQNVFTSDAEVEQTNIRIIGVGAGGAAGGELARYGPNPGGGGGVGKFMEIRGVAMRIAYVVDRSGSMMGNFDYVRQELKRSISELSPKQQFHVIFFAAGPPEENPPRKLVYATPRNKKQAFKFIDSIVEEGQTDPTEALKRAFELRPKPQLIYLLTDGEFDDDIIPKLRKWNADKKTVINCIAYLNNPGER